MGLGPTHKTSLQRLLEKSSRIRKSRLFRGSSSIDNDPNQQPYYVFDERMVRFISILIVVVGLIMLIAPLWALAFVRGFVHRLIIISAFTIVFFLLISFAVDAQPVDGLIATAG